MIHTRMRRFAQFSAAFIFLLAVVPGLCHAQTGDAEITGTVTDASGAVIPNAQVDLMNLGTGVARTSAANGDGVYRFSPLIPGTYRIVASAAGFQTETITNLIVNVSSIVTQNITLKIGSAGQSVEVQSETPMVDASSFDVSGVIDQQQITELPINTRQYLNLALLEPGTSQDASRSFYNNVQIGGGGYFYANGFMMDGVRNTWAEQGEPRQNFPEGAVQEFKVYVAQYPAEYGLYMGGLVTVATKSGTNNIHGEAFEYWRNEALNRDNEFQQQAEQLEHTGNPFNRNQFGGDFGGPIIKNRMHYYFAFERAQTTSSYTIFTSLPQFYGSNQGTFKQPLTDQMLTARMDYQINNKQLVFVRYAQEWNKQTYQGCGGAVEDFCYDGLIPRHSIVGGHTWTPSPSLVNDLRFQYAYASFQIGPPGHVYTDAQTLATSPAAIAASQIAYIFPSFAWGAGYQEVGVEQRYEGSDVVTLQRGKHTFKFGYDVNYVPFIDATATNVKGLFIFPTDQLFNPGNPATIAALQGPVLFEASLPPISTSVATWELGFFAADNWTVRPGLNVNLGLRYDREPGAANQNLNLASFPVPIPFVGNPSKRGSDKDFGPRVGIEWDPFHNERDVIKAGFGIYYNNIQTLQNFNEIRNFAQCTVVITNPSYPDPYGGQSPTNFCSTAPPNVTVLSQDYRNPYSEQFNVGYSHQFTNDTAITVSGVYQHYLHDFRLLDLNYPDAAGDRPLQNWGEILQQQPTAQAKYKALFVQADKRFTHRFTVRLSYTLSSASDDNPQYPITNYADPNLDWGPSNIDRRHMFVASGIVDLPLKFTLGVIWTAKSSVPFSALSADVNDDGTQLYVPGTSRNQGNRNLNLAAVNTYRASLGLAPVTVSMIDRNPYDSFDIHLSRRFNITQSRYIEGVVQVFNLFGHENLQGVAAGLTGYSNSAASATGFGTLTAAGNLQQAELAARFVF